MTLFTLIAAAALVLLLLLVVTASQSIKNIGPTEIGLVNKRFGRKLTSGNVIAMEGEAGYQENLLMPGWRFKLWPIFAITKYPWVQVPAGEIGVILAQVGAPLPAGAKSAVYKPEMGEWQDVRTFLDNGGQKGVQRPVLQPGTFSPIHPIAFMVITPQQVYGKAVSDELPVTDDGDLTAQSFGLSPDQLRVVSIAPRDGVDMIGVVETLEGDPLPQGAIACRLGEYDDIKKLEAQEADVATIMATLLGSKNHLHNNYQNFQAFLDNGGKIGLQHDPILAGAYLLNPFLVRVELFPMLVIDQGEVAVIKSYVGLPTEDTSGDDFKFGAIVQPGHQGIWSEPLRTGKYPLVDRCYKAVIVPTSILTLNWADATSQAHNLDAQLSPINGKSREGFEFNIDLQVQIHVPDTKAPKVISSVGTMQNLVNEVLQAAVGNYFRNTLQGLPAIEFIETRGKVQADAEEYIKNYLNGYEVETRGVYIQDVDLPDKLVQVLQAREIANQQKATFNQEKAAQDVRIEMEKSRGIADKQSDLAASQVSVTIATNNASARKAEADGQATYTRETGQAEADVIKAKGIGRAAGYEAQVKALGQGATALVAVASEVAAGHVKIAPDVLVTGGSSFDALAGQLVKHIPSLGGNGNGKVEEKKDAPKPPALEKKPEPRKRPAPKVVVKEPKEPETAAEARPLPREPETDAEGHPLPREPETDAEGHPLPREPKPGESVPAS